ncbi:MAG: hypothetical protein ABIP80_00550, partial [Ferruginibacter sp.]
MYKYLYSLIIFLSFNVSAANAQKPGTDNPLLIHSNEPVQFDKVNTAIIRNAVSFLLKISDDRIKKITDIPKASQNVSNILFATDELYYDLIDLAIKLGLIAATYTDDSIRNTANDESQKLSLYFNNL